MPIAEQQVPFYDVGIIGAGFSGVKALYECQKRGLTAHIYEGLSDIGGTWKSNNYPGARVDSPVPSYELDIPELYNTWKWSVKYPDWKEISKYFQHLDKHLQIKKDTTLNIKISRAEFDEDNAIWTVYATSDGEEYPVCTCKIFLPFVGIAANNYKPNLPGFEKFKGEVIHSSEWPELDEDTVLKGKKIAILGTGSTGVQLIQESGERAEELYVFQRTPNLSLPMGQKKLDGQNAIKESEYPALLKKRFVSAGGFQHDSYNRSTFEDSPEEREAFWDSLFEIGGFHFWVNNYKDLLIDDKANDEAYKYWRKYVHKIIKDPKTAETLAPVKKPHPFGTKRPSLQQNYFVQYNKPNVHLIDVNKTPIVDFYENGVVTSDGARHDLDLFILATGFDTLTGSFKNVDVVGLNKETNLFDEWNSDEGTNAYIGLAVSGYPNMFLSYGPHGPTALSNGPSCIEMQLDYIFDLVDAYYEADKNSRDAKKKYIDVSKEHQKQWRKRVDDYGYTTLIPKAKSWYMGSNIPGKKVQMFNFAEGVPAYYEVLKQSQKNNFNGFIIN